MNHVRLKHILCSDLFGPTPKCESKEWEREKREWTGLIRVRRCSIPQHVGRWMGGGGGGGLYCKTGKGNDKGVVVGFCKLTVFSAFILNRGEDRTPYSESFLDIRTFSGSEELSGKRKR